jgi:hypothetical protein
MSTYPNSGSFSIESVIPSSTKEPSLPPTQFGFSSESGENITIDDQDNYTDITATSYVTNTSGLKFTLSDETNGELTYNGLASFIEISYVLSISADTGIIQTTIACFTDEGSGYSENEVSGSITHANVPTNSSITIVSKFISFFNTGTKFKLRIKNRDSTDNYTIYTSVITAKNFVS